MVSYEHKRLVEHLGRLDEVPSDNRKIDSWLRGDNHLQLLRDDPTGSELMVTAFAPAPRSTRFNSYIVPASLPKIQEGPLSFAHWSTTPYDASAARYSWSRGSDGVNPSFETSGAGGRLQSEGSSLVFFRSAEGLSFLSREIAQDFVHASRIFWRRERKAYSKLDHRGDWLDVVSQSFRDDSAPIDLISVHRETIDLHLVALNAVLVRVFEFDLSRLPHGVHPDFERSTEREHTADGDLQYRELTIEGQLNRIRGAQIIRPQLSTAQVEQLALEGRIQDPSENEPVEFQVDDWRNARIATVSTDPSTTTNYFAVRGNSLPFETSPAMFRPEVLLKYKGDNEKYAVREDWIECRGAWLLKRYSINDAGQAAVYICDLRELPHEELLHWKSFNEEPRAGISERACKADFLAEWPDEMTAREKLVDVLHGWASSDDEWWTWRPEESPDARVVVPRSGSRSEWESALRQLANDVIEGFDVKELRQTLTAQGEEVDAGWRSVALLERILRSFGVIQEAERLSSLRELIAARNLGGVHAQGSSSKTFVQNALEQHETYAAHFEDLCESLADELMLVAQALRRRVEE